MKVHRRNEVKLWEVTTILWKKKYKQKLMLTSTEEYFSTEEA
jgi:hypothetical protein